VEPLFFGTAGARLYGVHHPPEARPRRDLGVVLCHPAVQEYNRSHWAFRRLAVMLARSGFSVLRFDYRGTGDSAGDLEDAGVPGWCADIREAADELRGLSGVRRISLVGFRLGAALAALASTTGLDVQDLVLWEPAVDGREHLDDLRRIHRWKLRLTSNAPRVGRSETLGYAMPSRLRAEIAGIDLDAVARCRAERVLVFAAEDRASLRRIAARLGARPPGSFQLDLVPEAAEDHLDGVLLSSRVQREITRALGDAAA
jgi:uncharacterized protein